MSRALQDAAEERGISVTNVFGGDELRNGWPRKKGDLKGATVGIDFSGAEAVVGNVKRSVELGLPLVVGTTGWHGVSAEVEGIVHNGEGTLLHSPNFAISGQLLFHLVALTGSWLDRAGGFDPYVSEHHHAAKKDAPCATALRVGEILLERMSDKDLLQLGLSAGERAPNQLSIASARAGSSPGRHVVGFDGAHELLELIHTVRDHQAYAAGALQAASWLTERTGIFTLMDVVEDLTRAVLADLTEGMNDVHQ